jgi:hypothetical protein
LGFFAMGLRLGRRIVDMSGLGRHFDAWLSRFAIALVVRLVRLVGLRGFGLDRRASLLG